MTLVADSSGKVSGHFQIPPNVPAGAKLVTFAGQGGSNAAATFIGRGQITQTEMRQVEAITTITTTMWEHIDPLAQTFTLDDAGMISGVDLFVCSKGTAGRTLVQIRETQVGIPTAVALVTVVLPTVSLVTGAWNRIVWNPLRLEKGVEYAIVVGCDDADTQVGIATLGQFDSTLQRFVTQQPYQIGVLLSSSNGSTWTPHQESDLAFKLLKTPISTTTLTVPLPSITVTNCDELMVLAAVDVPTSDCSVVFRLTLPDNTQVMVGSGEKVLLPATTSGIIQLAAILTGSVDATPKLNRNVQVVWGTRANTGTYYSRALPAGGAANPSTISVYYEALTPGTSSFLVEVAQDAAGTGGWQTVPVVGGTPVGDGWISTTCRLTGYNKATAFVRITGAGDARQRPMIRKGVEAVVI